MPRLIRNIHLWTGLVGGILFCLMSVSGSLIVFRPEIEKMLRPRWTPHSLARPTSVLTEAARNIAREWPGASILSVSLPPGAGDPHEFSVRTPANATIQVFTDAQSGEVLGTFELSWLNWIVDFHHNLQMGPQGRSITGVIGVGLLAVSLTGLVLWFRRNKGWKHALRIERGGSWKRTNFDLHRASGLLSNAFLVILSITGIYLAWPQTIQRVFGIAPNRQVRVAPVSSERQSAEQLAAAAQRAFPGGVITQIRFPGGVGRTVAVRLSLPGDLRAEGSNRVYLDPSTAQVIQIDRASDWPWAKKLTQAAAPLHYGEVGGLNIKVLWALAGLAPPLLFASGFLIWWQPWRARRKATSRSPAEAVYSR